ncbi:streptomycin biosynthesis regulator, partial [Streptomyces sp. NPDC047097]
PADTAEAGRPHRPAAAAAHAHRELDTLVKHLCKDPALRLSDNGRLLLRMLDLQLAGARLHRQILAAVPEHRAAMVAAAATECARTWQDMAAHLLRTAPEHTAP